MDNKFTITKKFHIRRERHGQKVMDAGAETKSEGNVPRIARLMALAIRMRELVDEKSVTDYAELARLAHVTRARMTQVMNLLSLAPDIQEEILFLPLSDGGRDPVREKMIRPIASIPDWRKQRAMWRELLAQLLK